MAKQEEYIATVKVKITADNMKDAVGSVYSNLKDSLSYIELLDVEEIKKCPTE